MKFGPVPVASAEGAVLAHTLHLAGGALKKGRRLTAEDVRRLAEAGQAEVMAALAEPGDVGEDDAARRVAEALAGPGVTVAAAFTGRANIFAAADGIATLDRDLVIRLNAIDEGLTLATVPPFERVTAGQMIATVKVITFSLPEAVVAAAVDLARSAVGSGSGAIGLSPFAARRAGLVLTEVTGTRPAVLAKREAAMRTRLEALGGSIARVERVPHRTDAVAGAIAEMAAAGLDPILVFGASAIVDRGDVVPAGLSAAGGTIVHLGMPVDPGNLLLIGRIGAADVIGVPSCASSPKINGFDWVLERRAAGLPVRRGEIIAMAPGGLLKEIESRPQPRHSASARGSASGEPRRAPRIAALVLAAGRSSRMGPSNKLIAEWRGKPLVRHVAEAALASRADPVVVVTGHMERAVREALSGLDVRLVSNDRFAEGLSTSLAAGLDALAPEIDGALVLLGDMPGVTPAHLDRLIAAFAPKEGRAICIPLAGGRRGNPVLWARAFFDEMRAVKGDTGARHLIGEHAEEVAEVEIADEAVLTDIDTPEALARLRAGDAAAQK
ncbi:MAG: molybdopterin-binding/glycosyltransferase family 2 protein [Hyphomicrobiaceae bacterium]